MQPKVKMAESRTRRVSMEMKIAVVRKMVEDGVDPESAAIAVWEAEEGNIIGG